MVNLHIVTGKSDFTMKMNNVYPIVYLIRYTAAVNTDACARHLKAITDSKITAMAFL